MRETNHKKNRLIVLVGPTGIGKTDLSIELAFHLKTVIISCDSRQIFKELIIGTAVPSVSQLSAVKHYFIASHSIYDYFNASMYECEVNELLLKLFKTNQSVLMVGGSGMYVDAVCKGIDDLPSIDPDVREKLITQYENEGISSLRQQLKKLDPDYYNKVDLKNAKRILKAIEVCMMTGKPYSSFLTHSKKDRNYEQLKIGLNMNRGELYDRINQRVDGMIASGLIEEARELYKDKHLNSLNTVGYKELFDYFDNKISLTFAIDLIKRNSRRYAKRQLSWFMRDKEIKWFHPTEKQEISDYLSK